MKIALINVSDPDRKVAMNKDLAGGMGTFSNFGVSLTSRLVSSMKKKSVKIPVLSYAYLQGIFKKQGHEVDYIECADVDEIDDDYDLILIYGSIVDFKYENEIGKKAREKCRKAKVGFFGTFPSVKPELFKCDFVLKGEAEGYFLYEFKKLEELKGVINIKKNVEMNDLPTPDYTGFPIQEYSYFPAIKEKPFLVLQASRGCPYSCGYYCPYPTGQGSRYRIRDAEKIVDDIETMIKKHGVKGVQFRDPIFGLNKKQVEDFIKLMKERNVKIKFGIETRLDLLNREMLKNLFDVGLRNLNIGVETMHEDVAKANKRMLIDVQHQEDVILYCHKIGVKISAFYIFGLATDTEENIKKTVDYAIKLNTNVAQFCISCPYPGTKYYDEVKEKGLLREEDFERFNSTSLVFEHNNLSAEKLMELKEYAFKKYYFRPGYMANFLRWRVREFWL